MTALLLHCLQGCDSSTPSNKDCSLTWSIAKTPWTPPPTLPPHQGTLVTVVDSPFHSDGCWLSFDLHIGHPHDHLVCCFGCWPVQITIPHLCSSHKCTSTCTLKCTPSDPCSSMETPSTVAALLLFQGSHSFSFSRLVGGNTRRPTHRLLIGDTLLLFSSSRSIAGDTRCPTHGLRHAIKGLLSLLLTHHFTVMDVDCHLTCTSVIPMIIWFVVLAVGLFKSSFHICVRHTNALPHALSSALLLIHARPWKHLPQSRHSFSSKGPTPSLSAGWLLATHAAQHADCSLETHSFFSHHLGQLLATHTVRHTDSDTRILVLSCLSDTRIPPDTRGIVCLSFAVDTRLPLCMATRAD